MDKTSSLEFLFSVKKQISFFSYRSHSSCLSFHDIYNLSADSEPLIGRGLAPPLEETLHYQENVQVVSDIFCLTS